MQLNACSSYFRKVTLENFFFLYLKARIKKAKERVQKQPPEVFCKKKVFLKLAISKTWTRTLDLGPEKPGPRKTWTLKNVGNS